MHRMIETLPAADACRDGHAARLMQDLRGPHFGGGLYVECPCCRGNTCAQREMAISNWSRINGRPVPKAHVAAVRRVG
ncbi:hypothetical protein [Luteimonas terrae]|uniref:Uncharacterized protein n=1 Tax=Luteimonas terrae TaxID=1530191 RepID=A0ABU1XX96_9GAMM|nr:hypothetical protein [Luteimonas terrae]MDR7193387.1 hypothetical protein [Luteimonas terrae]